MNPVSGHLQIPEIGYNEEEHIALKGTAHIHKARSEPEYGASPEAGAVGHPPGAADRNRIIMAVGSAGRARYSAQERAWASHANLGGTANEAHSSHERDGCAFEF